MNVFKQPGIHGQAVAFSPYHPDLLATVGAQYYGIAGCGQLSVLQQGPEGMVERHRLEWPDGLFDCSWSEQNEHHIVTAAGDGSVQLWDIGVVGPGAMGPIGVFRGHSKEAVSVHWSQTRGQAAFLSGSWDSTINLWDPTSQTPVASFREHLAMVYAAKWSPRKPETFASVSGDCQLKVWDCRNPGHSMQSFKAHDYEILCCDWAKYDENVIVTGSVDKSVRGFDIRAGPGAPPLFVLEGHSYAVRQVKTSPHHPTLIASCGYDFTIRLWDTALPRGQQLVKVFDEHTEFVIGLDYSTHAPGVLADCSWDENVVIRNVN